MTIVKTNSGLGYDEYAYLVALDVDSYLCINMDYPQDVMFPSYELGKITKLEESDIEETSYTLEESPIYDSIRFLIPFIKTSIKLFAELRLQGNDLSLLDDAEKELANLLSGKFNQE